MESSAVEPLGVSQILIWIVGGLSASLFFCVGLITRNVYGRLGGHSTFIAAHGTQLAHLQGQLDNGLKSALEGLSERVNRMDLKIDTLLESQYRGSG